MFQIRNKSDIIDSYLSGVRDFPNTILTAVNFTKSNLEQINLDDSNLIEVNWSNSSLNQASFSRTCLCLSNFDNCCLIQANFPKANLTEANFTEANLENANLGGANLEGANFQRANLKGADMRNIKLDKACFAGAIYNNKTLFDRDFDPQALGMIAEDMPKSKDLQSSSLLSQQNYDAVKKILSWCLSHKSNLQTQD